MADVPKAKATILLEGRDTQGRRVKRWLDAPPTFKDTVNLTAINITGLRPITLKAVRDNLYGKKRSGR